MITSTELQRLLYDLPTLVAATRRRRRQNIRDAADRIGCAVSTVSRIENGYGCDATTLVRVLRWIETP